MRLERIRQNILNKQRNLLNNLKKKELLKQEIEKQYRMGVDFQKFGNYSSAYFMFFKCLKNCCLLYLHDRLGQSDLNENEALDIVSAKKYLGLSKEKVEELRKAFLALINREEIIRKDVNNIKKIVNAVKKKVLKSG